MKILLSAYACEPNRGSEPWVGWQWAISLANRGHRVYVLTRLRNSDAIEAYQDKPDNLHFIYYDVPKWLSFWKKGQRGVHLYYWLWQWGAFIQARRWHCQIQFECVHHVTFVSMRQPSFMGWLGIPFLFGPVAGGEDAPSGFWYAYPWRGKCIALLRTVQLKLVHFDLWWHLTLLCAHKIIVTTPQTAKQVPAWYHHKLESMLAIGVTDVTRKRPDVLQKQEAPFHWVYVGRLIYWKGVHLALQAFAKALKQNPAMRFTIIGSGEDSLWLHQMAIQLNIQHAVEWIEWLPREQMLKNYSHYHALLYPSLHDSGGLVVLEALQYGLPVLCLNLGGPGQIVDNTCGHTVLAEGKTPQQVVCDLSETMVQWSTEGERYQQLCDGTFHRLSAFEWDNKIDVVYKDLPSA